MTNSSKRDAARLPLPDSHADVVVCALALTHLPDLSPAFAEFARMLRPGGHLVITDVHQALVALGSVPRMRSATGEPALLPAYRHLAGDYPGAALPLGFAVRRCAEPRVVGRTGGPPGMDFTVGPWDLWPWSLQDLVPAATKAAFDGTPATIVWQFQLG